MINVVNINQSGLIGEYIGRAGKGKKASPLANPFKIGSDRDRAAALKEYRLWLDEKLADPSSPQSLELERLRKLFIQKLRTEEDLNLCCFCSPAPCHGDYIKQLILGRAANPVQPIPFEVGNWIYDRSLNTHFQIVKRKRSKDGSVYYLDCDGITHFHQNCEYYMGLLGASEESYKPMGAAISAILTGCDEYDQLMEVENLKRLKEQDEETFRALWPFLTSEAKQIIISLGKRLESDNARKN